MYKIAAQAFFHQINPWTLPTNKKHRNFQRQIKRLKKGCSSGTTESFTFFLSFSPSNTTTYTIYTVLGEGRQRKVGQGHWYIEVSSTFTFPLMLGKGALKKSETNNEEFEINVWQQPCIHLWRQNLLEKLPKIFLLIRCWMENFHRVCGCTLQIE